MHLENCRCLLDKSALGQLQACVKIRNSSDQILDESEFALRKLEKDQEDIYQ